MKEKLEFVEQVIGLVKDDFIGIEDFNQFFEQVNICFPCLTEDISYSYLQIVYHHIKELAE